MRTLLHAASVFLLAAGFSGCAGYHLGETKPGTLKGVHTIAVNMFRNNTFIPRVEALATNSVIKQIQQDGTYRVTTSEQADAILEGTVTVIGRSPARSLRGNVLATTEFNLGVNLAWTLKGKNGQIIAGPGVTNGGTSFFVGADVTTDERQALPLAVEDLAVRLVSQLTEGW